jgi:prevent-host-death family protein
MRSMAVGEFKAKCLAVIEEVKTTGETVLLTKRGMPVARVTSLIEIPREKGSILGRLQSLGKIQGDVVTSDLSDEEWDRMSDEPWPGDRKERSE